MTNLIKAVLSIPTAPGHEYLVRRVIERFFEVRRIPHCIDKYGNLIANCEAIQDLRKASTILVIHMDHPGGSLKVVEGEPLVATWYGGSPLNLMDHPVCVFDAAGKVIPGMVSMAEEVLRKHSFTVRVGEKLKAGEYGVTLDLPLSVGESISARALDNLISVAISLEYLDAGGGLPIVYSRAEEEGLVGALKMAVELDAINPEAAIIAVDIMGEQPGARLGGGVAIRRGDQDQLFDSELCDQLIAIARNYGIRHQEILRSSGRSEALPFYLHHHPVASFGLVVENYHNKSPIVDQPCSEKVLNSDCESLLEILLAIDDYLK